MVDLSKIKYKCASCKKQFNFKEIGSVNEYNGKRLLRCPDCTERISFYMSSQTNCLLEQHRRKNLEEVEAFLKREGFI